MAAGGDSIRQNARILSGPAEPRRSRFPLAASGGRGRRSGGSALFHRIRATASRSRASVSRSSRTDALVERTHSPVLRDGLRIPAHAHDSTELSQEFRAGMTRLYLFLETAAGYN